MNELETSLRAQKATAVQMPLSAVQLGDSVAAMRSFLEKSVKTFDKVNSKGATGHLSLARARRQIQIKLCQHISDLYKARERYEVGHSRRLVR